MLPVPGCSRAARDGDADGCLEAGHHLNGLPKRNDKHWLFPVAVREVTDFPTAMQ